MSLEMKLLDLCRECKLDIGQPIPMRRMMSFQADLNPKERKDLPDILERLSQHDLFEKKNEQFLLTEAGLNYIYDDNSLEMKILDFCRKYKLDIGQSIPQKPLMLFATDLNPKERRALPDMLERHVGIGLFEKRNGEFVLTEQGFNTLYQDD